MPNTAYSFIIPCYNEPPEVLQRTLQQLDQHLQGIAAIEYEIIVVDDGSTRYQYPDFPQDHIHLLHHPENRGYGASLMTGILAAHHDWVGIIDADSTYPIEYFAEFMRHTPQYDIIVGERKLKDVEFLRRFPKYLLYKTASYLSGQPIPDLNSGMRLFKKDIALKYRKMFPQKFSFTSTLTMIGVTNFYQLKYVPIPYYKRTGQSKIHPIKDTLRFFMLVTRLSLYFKPLRFFLPLSTLILLLAILRGLRDVLLVNHLGGLALVLFFMAFQVFFFGLLAEIISKK